ncbi:MAG: GNAT family N-acetyltransferase [Bacillota bacterium]
MPLDIEVVKTTKRDLDNVCMLWNDGDVMRYVGFPEGLGVSTDQLEKWLASIDGSPFREHFSIYARTLGYCGESFYSADEPHRMAALDIKLLRKARGHGIAQKALMHAIEQAFSTGVVDTVYVDPDPANQKALRLYERLGFKPAPRPSFLEPSKTHYELTFEQYTKIKKAKG